MAPRSRAAGHAHRAAPPIPSRRAPAWLRSARRRPVAFVCLLVLSGSAVLISVLAPLLLHAVQDRTLAAATAPGLPGTSIVGLVDVNDQTFDAAIESVREIAAAPRTPGLWRPLAVTVRSAQPVRWSAPTSGKPIAAGLAVVPCATVHLAAGRCPVARGEVVVPAIDAVGLRIGIGDRVSIDTGSTTAAARAAGRVRIVGTSRAAGGGDLVVSAAGFHALGVAGRTRGVRTLARPLRQTDGAAVRRDAALALAASVDGVGAVALPSVDTSILDVLRRDQQQNAAAAVLVTAIALEALLLAWFAEAAVVQRIARSRAGEWGVGRLRGLRRGPWLVTVFTEPLVAVLLGAVLGFAAGIGLAAAVVRGSLGPSGAVTPLDPPVLLVAALAVGGSLVALVGASIRSARLPLPALLRETTEPRELTRTAVVAHSGVLLVTVVVLYALLTQGSLSGSQIGLLAPGLLALAVGLVALRLAVAVVRRGTRRPPRSLGGLVVGRRLSRAPSLLSASIAVTVGVALAASATEIAFLALRLETQRAGTVIGAPTVLLVRAPRSSTLRTAVRAADPSGRAAMAVEELHGGSFTDASHVVAVDTARLAAVTSWPVGSDRLSAAALVDRLTPAVGPSLRLRGSVLRMRMTNARPFGRGRPIDLELLAAVQDRSGRISVASFGTPRDGALASTTVPCTAGCRLAWLGARNIDPAKNPWSLSFGIESLSTDRQPAAVLAPWLEHENRWLDRIGAQQDPTQPAVGGAENQGKYLYVTLSDHSGGYTPSIRTDDTVEPLPALAARGTLTEPFAGISSAVLGSALDQGSILLQLVDRARVLPRALNSGVLVDLGLMGRVTDSSQDRATQEVWLAPGPHPQVLATLAREHVRVLGRQEVAGTTAEFMKEAPPRAAVLSGVIGAAAIVLAVLALIASRLIGVADRRRDWESLQAAGVPARSIRRLLTIEVLVPGAVAALLGALAAIAVLALTAPRLPLLAGAGPVPAPDYSPPLPALALLVLGAVAAIAAVAAIGARLEVRGRG